ncbi:MAG: tautomerase family protein [Pseudomonadota bacterium]
MPVSKLHVPADLPATICRAMAEALHESLVATCAVHPDDNTCLITRYAPEDRIIHPSFLGQRDPGQTVIVEIILRSGRTDAQKEALYTDFRQRLGEIGFDPRNSIMGLVENESIDWSFGPEGSVKTVLGL